MWDPFSPDKTVLGETERQEAEFCDFIAPAFRRQVAFQRQGLWRIYSSVRGRTLMDLLVSSFYFIAKTNSCLFDIQFHRLPCRTCSVKHCQDWNKITFDFSEAKISIQREFQVVFSLHVPRLCSLFIWFYGWNFFAMNHCPQYFFYLLMNFNQVCQAGSSLSYNFTEVFTWLEDKYLNTALNWRKPVQTSPSSRARSQ